MGVSIKGKDALIRSLAAKADRMVAAFSQNLDLLGLKAVRFIRDRGAEASWTDQTGNLRSSIGYILVRDGEVISGGGFETVNGPRRGDADKDGSKEGRGFADSLAERYPAGYALIVVAGMDYAAYVEAMDNKDVLAGGEIFLRKEVRKLAERFSKRYGRKT